MDVDAVTRAFLAMLDLVLAAAGPSRVPGAPGAAGTVSEVGATA
jgi:hypothetical protein